MRLFARLRALFTLIALVSYSPLGQADSSAGQMGLSVFIGRFSRAAAAQVLDPTKADVARCPSRYVRRTIAETCVSRCRSGPTGICGRAHVGMAGRTV
jgi:hypothetical protein